MKPPRPCVLPLIPFIILGCAQDPDVERRGGALPDAMLDPDPDPTMNAGGASNGGVAFCAALSVIRSKCQRCHTEPPENGAPVAFLTYEDTQASYFDTKRKWAEVMLDAVTKGFMPFVRLNDPPTSLMPPVEPLSEAEKATLLGWLNEGALPTGGTDCPE